MSTIALCRKLQDRNTYGNLFTLTAIHALHLTAFLLGDYLTMCEFELQTIHYHGDKSNLSEFLLKKINPPCIIQ